jgi:peptidoglycan/LPS O-acetylase OafA/YrhL
VVPRLPAIAQGVLAFGISVGCSYIIYSVVEKPCAKLRRKLE